jgi:hypothetical protein
MMDRLWTAAERAIFALNDAGARRGWLMAMHPDLAAAFTREHALALAAYDAGDLDGAVGHIERAHILGSHFWSTHLRAHWLMLRIGVRKHDPYEVFIQALRTTGTFGTRLLAPFFGTTGNPGTAQYSVGDRFAIAPELTALLDRQSFTTWRWPFSRR